METNRNIFCRSCFRVWPALQLFNDLFLINVVTCYKINWCMHGKLVLDLTFFITLYYYCYNHLELCRKEEQCGKWAYSSLIYKLSLSLYFVQGGGGMKKQIYSACMSGWFIVPLIDKFNYTNILWKNDYFSFGLGHVFSVSLGYIRKKIEPFDLTWS